MNVRYSVASAVAVALVLGASSAASAQADTTRRTTSDSTRRTTSDTTRRTTSQQRVRVTKESAGDVTTKANRDSVARADSIARMETMRRDSVARADSLARLETMRRDSITRDSTARADSIRRARPDTTPSTTTVPSTTTTSDTIRSPGLPTMESESYGASGRSFYVGLGGGTNIPTGVVNDVYKSGFGVTVPIGWQPMNSPFGLRLDLGYSRLNGRSAGENGLTSQPDDPNIWSATANATLDLLRFGESRRGALYLVGGGGVFRFTDFYNFDRSDNDPESAFEGEPVTKGGLTGGAGLAFPIGGTSLFVESRYTTAYTEGENTKWVPVIVGLKWR